MHPVNYLFDEIYRNWGISPTKRETTRRQGRVQSARALRFLDRSLDRFKNA